MEKNKGQLLLLPNLLGPDLKDHKLFLPSSIDEALLKIDGLIAESDGGARRFLKRFQTKKPPHLMPTALLNKHTSPLDYDFLLEPIANNQETWGLISDAGLPCIADPGAALVYRARQRGIAVDAFCGPSSLFLALMLSGLPAQRFAFHGYLSREEQERKDKIKELEKISAKEQMTQMMMETPHRAKEFLSALLSELNASTLLTVATDLTLPSQLVETFAVSTWRKRPLPSIDGRPSLFLFLAN